MQPGVKVMSFCSNSCCQSSRLPSHCYSSHTSYIPNTTRYLSAPMPLHSHPLHYSKSSTGYPLNGEYISNWPPWRIRHCTLASHLTCPNCHNIMNPHGLCDLTLLFNSLFHDTTLNLARMHFESQHQKSGIYCLLVSVILHQSLHFAGI